MINSANKPETRFKREKKLKPATVDFENIFFETATLFAESAEKTRAERAIIRRRTKTKTRMRDQIIHAETWPERDRLLRSLAAKCYSVANSFSETDPDKMLKWMRLVSKLLGLSFTPKRLEDLEFIKKEMAEVKAQMRELEEDGATSGEG